MKVVKNATGTGYVRVGGDPKPIKAGSPDYVTTSGSLTVTVHFDGGTKSGVNLDSILDGIKGAVTKVTGASDIRLNKGGAALILNAVAS